MPETIVSPAAARLPASAEASRRPRSELRADHADSRRAQQGQIAPSIEQCRRIGQFPQQRRIFAVRPEDDLHAVQRQGGLPFVPCLLLPVVAAEGLRGLEEEPPAVFWSEGGAFSHGSGFPGAARGLSGRRGFLTGRRDACLCQQRRLPDREVCQRLQCGTGRSELTQQPAHRARAKPLAVPQGQGGLEFAAPSGVKSLGQRGFHGGACDRKQTVAGWRCAVQVAPKCEKCPCMRPERTEAALQHGRSRGVQRRPTGRRRRRCPPCPAPVGQKQRQRPCRPPALADRPVCQAVGGRPKKIAKNTCQGRRFGLYNSSCRSGGIGRHARFRV